MGVFLFGCSSSPGISDIVLLAATGLSDGEATGFKMSSCVAKSETSNLQMRPAAKPDGEIRKTGTPTVGARLDDFPPNA
jgi:hypothetical protein